MNIEDLKLKEQRSNRHCWYCSRRMLTGKKKRQNVETRSTREHLIPKSQGGTDSLSNIRNTCAYCNQLVGAWSLKTKLCYREFCLDEGINQVKLTLAAYDKPIEARIKAAKERKFSRKLLKRKCVLHVKWKIKRNENCCKWFSVLSEDQDDRSDI